MQLSCPSLPGTQGSFLPCIAPTLAFQGPGRITSVGSTISFDHRLFIVQMRSPPNGLPSQHHVEVAAERAGSSAGVGYKSIMTKARSCRLATLANTGSRSFSGSPGGHLGDELVIGQRHLAWLRGESTEYSPRTAPEQVEPTNAVVTPPALPAQGVGPHFEVDEKGVIRFAPPEALDRYGNNVRRLRSLHPTICGLSRDLAEALARGNSPHGYLRSRIVSYSKLLIGIWMLSISQFFIFKAYVFQMQRELRKKK